MTTSSDPPRYIDDGRNVGAGCLLGILLSGLAWGLLFKAIGLW